MKIQLPNGWRPRGYQLDAWKYLENGGKHAELVWHRRSGKDEVCLHRTAVASFERVAGYWHMLPEYSQARKAIWNAINPHTGLRRIDEAFPHEIRAKTQDHEMMIHFKNGSTWQLVGSDNFNSLVGSAVAGITYSEWALANPDARAYLRPIIAENNGWQIFNTTARGRNHAYRTYEAARKNPDSFAQLLSATQSGIFTPEQLERERQEYVENFGEAVGNARFEQEYLCSFDAAIFGAVYGRELSKLRELGHITKVNYDPELEVFVVMDIGWNDDTSIWFFQVIRGEIHVIDCYSAHGEPVEHYVSLLDSKGYNYAKIGQKPMLLLPHDAKAKTLAAKGKSVQQQFLESGYDSRIVPSLSLIDGIQAARKTLPLCWFDEDRCFEGLEALTQYQYEWDTERKKFDDKPLHDWTSHFADAFRYLSIVWAVQMQPKAPEPARYPQHRTFNELMELQRRKREE